MSEVDLTAQLGELLRDSDSDLRIQAALALGQQQHPAAIAPLVAALGDQRTQRQVPCDRSARPSARDGGDRSAGRHRGIRRLLPVLSGGRCAGSHWRSARGSATPEALVVTGSQRDRGRSARRAWRGGRRAAARGDAERGECRGTDCPCAREALHTLRGPLPRRRVHHLGIPVGHRTDRRADAARCGGGRRRRGHARRSCWF